jgi:CBS domain containing-hemolysin-like protein
VFSLTSVVTNLVSNPLAQAIIPESTVIRDLVWLVILLIASALCSAAETAIMSLDNFRLRSQLPMQLVKKRKRRDIVSKVR